jgi:hypothetical protein
MTPISPICLSCLSTRMFCINDNTRISCINDDYVGHMQYHDCVGTIHELDSHMLPLTCLNHTLYVHVLEVAPGLDLLKVFAFHQ